MGGTPWASRNTAANATSRSRPSRAAGRRRHAGLKFVIQKHAASHLHYDFRLELDGVLKSWAVPKGPSLDPAQKRLAVHVEDHPLEYGDFEGIIPQVNMAAGRCSCGIKARGNRSRMAKRGYRDGSLKFTLHGQKLRGGWMLVRRGGKRGDPHERNWFLFKERRAFAQPKVDVTAKLPLSVTTGRDLEEIAPRAKRVWGPNGEEDQSGRRKRSSKKSSTKSKKKAASRAAKAPTVAAKHRQEKVRAAGKSRRTCSTSQATRRQKVGDAAQPGGGTGHARLHAAGRRRVAARDQVRRLSHAVPHRRRQGSLHQPQWARLDEEFPAWPKRPRSWLSRARFSMARWWCFRVTARPSFQALQNAFQGGGDVPFLFYVFDVLYLNGHDVRPLAIEIARRSSNESFLTRRGRSSTAST